MKKCTTHTTFTTINYTAMCKTPTYDNRHQFGGKMVGGTSAPGSPIPQKKKS